MSKTISTLREPSFFQKCLYIGIVATLFLYCFSIPSFGSRERLNYILYGLMLILFCFVILYYVFFEKLHFNKWLIPIFMFSLFSILGTMLFSHEYRSFLTLLLLSISSLIIYYSCLIIKNTRLVLIVVVSALFAFSCYYILVYRNQILDVSGYISGNVRLGTYFDNQNAVSAFSTIGYLLSLYSLLFINRKYRYFFIFPILTLTIVGISTGSRTFVVTFILLTILLLFFRLKKHPFVFFVILGLFIVSVIIIFSMPFMTTLRDRFIRIFWTFFTDSSRVDSSTLQRITWLDYGFFIGNKHILTGVGVVGFGNFSGVGTYTHSNFSEVWCDFGLPGFILFYLPMVICVVKSLFEKSSNKSLIITIFIYYLVVSFSNVFYYFKFYYFNLAFMYYLAFNTGIDTSAFHINSINDYVKKILFTCEGLEGGGAEKVIASLSNEFSSRGYKVVIVGVSTHNKNAFYNIDSGVRYDILHKDSAKRIKPLKRLLLLRKLIKKEKPNVIISFLPHVNIYTYFATIGLNIPVIISERNNPKVDPKGFMLRRLKTMSFIQADGVVFQTNESKWCYRKSIRDKSTIICNPIDPSLHSVKAENHNKKIVLSVGRLTEQKNFKCLIDAFSIFHLNHSEYVLRIYGEGHLHDELIDYSKAKGLKDSFELLPPDNNWHNKEKDDAVFVLTSNYEGMPNALMEAMCIGIPCISTDSPSGGSFELITSGVNGYLTKVGDAQAIAEKMNLIIHKPFVYDVKEYASQYDINIISQQWLDYIKQVLEVKYSV